MKTETIPTRWCEAKETLARRFSNAVQLLVACDYDGTLSPIVSRPTDAVLARGAIEVLRDLLALPGIRLAIVSGRSLDDLAARVPLPDVILVGNHGLETRGLGLDSEVSAAAAQRGELGSLMESVTLELQTIPGILIESKGLTASVHYRNTPPTHFSRIAETLNRLVTDTRGFDLHHGKMVWEVKPQVSWHKGTALRFILERFGLSDSMALFLGDDATDEFVFDSLPSAITVFVGPLRATKARWRADDPDDVVRFLDWLARARRECTRLEKS